MLLSPAGTWLSTPTTPGPLRWSQPAAQGVCRKEGCTSYFMLKINFQTRGLTPAEFACSRMRHLGCRKCRNPWGLHRKPSCENPALLSNKAQCKDTKAGWDTRPVVEQLHVPKTSLPQDFPCSLQAIFNLEAPQQENQRPMRLPTSKGSRSHPWCESALALGLIWALRGLLYGLKEEEEAKNFLITAPP